MLRVCPSRHAFLPMHRITEHDGTVSLLDSCLHGNAESGDNLEASRRPLDFVEALNGVEETAKRRTTQSRSNGLALHEWRIFIRFLSAK